MRMMEITSEADPALRYRFEADDSGAAVVTILYGEEPPSSAYRLHRQTTIALLKTVREFLEQADPDEDSLTGLLMEPGVNLRAEARVIRSVRNELAVQICVVAGLTIDLRLSMTGSRQLLQGLTELVPLRSSDIAAA
jgi:hypothetical protein